MNAADFTIERFEALDFDPDAFDHRAHVFVARLYLERYSEHDAVDHFRRALRRLTAQLGAPGKYHETITRFYLDAIARRLAERPGEDWAGFQRSNPDLFDGSAVSASYSKERLASADARRRYLSPDRNPCPAGG